MCVAPPTIGGLGWQPVSVGEESAGMDGSHFDQLVRTSGVLAHGGRRSAAWLVPLLPGLWPLAGWR